MRGGVQPTGAVYHRQLADLVKFCRTLNECRTFNVDSRTMNVHVDR